MLRRAVCLLPSSIRALSEQGAPCLQRFYSDLNITDRATFKKFIGIEDALGAEADARGKLSSMLNELLQSLKVLPESSDYRRAVEATAQYRLKVLEQNESDLAVEEVLDSHMEELILETKEELQLVPLMTGEQQGYNQHECSSSSAYLCPVLHIARSCQPHTTCALHALDWTIMVPHQHHMALISNAQQSSRVWTCR